MSPALLKKYLAAAQQVANHVVFLPEGIAFAPYPVVTDTDRDRYCVERLVEFYRQHDVQLADIFDAAWQFNYREQLGRPHESRVDVASRLKVSPTYLETIWQSPARLQDTSGPLAVTSGDVE